MEQYAEIIGKCGCGNSCKVCVTVAPSVLNKTADVGLFWLNCLKVYVTGFSSYRWISHFFTFCYGISRKKSAFVGIQWLSYVASCEQGVFTMLGLRRTAARSSFVFLCSGEVRFVFRGEKYLGQPHSTSRTSVLCCTVFVYPIDIQLNLRARPPLIPDYLSKILKSVLLACCCFNPNCNKIVKSDWPSTALISALIE